MKGQPVGTVSLLWPNDAAMSALHKIACQKHTNDEISTLDLLWPAHLINEQARLRTHRNWATPLAVWAFLLSLILAFIIGPLQMILVAATLDYSWVTTVYYPTVLNFALTTSGLIALLSALALALSWRSHPKITFTNVVLILGALIELATIWISGRVYNWAPHTTSLVLLVIAAIFIVLALLVNKQFFRKTQNTSTTKVFLSLLIVFALSEAILSIIHLFEPALAHNTAKVEQQAIAQEQAQLPGIPRALSDLVYVLCAGSYQTVYHGQSADNGLFECTNSGEVYSVQEVPERSNKAMFGAATYLGTTHDAAVSLAFPNARYLYLSIPGVSTEDELVIMYPAATEQELIDNITQPLLEYWQSHHGRDLFISIFYNDDFRQINSTRDYILMTALDTMTLHNTLPHGNTLEGYFNNAIVPYNYSVDTELKALHELSGDPALYANSSRVALTNSRHISLHLHANTELNFDTLRELLQNSFVGGI